MKGLEDFSMSRRGLVDSTLPTNLYWSTVQGCHTPLFAQRPSGYELALHCSSMMSCSQPYTRPSQVAHKIFG